MWPGLHAYIQKQDRLKTNDPPTHTKKLEKQQMKGKK